MMANTVSRVTNTVNTKIVNGNVVDRVANAAVTVFTPYSGIPRCGGSDVVPYRVGFSNGCYLLS